MAGTKKGKPAEKMIEVFVLKYWETQGVFLVRGGLVHGGKYFRQEDRQGQLPLFVSRRDYALTEEEARKRVSELLASKIKSVEAKLRTLKALDPMTMPFAGAKGG
jgi:hypothetical protein